MEEEIKQGETSSAPAVGQPEVSEAPAQEVSEQKKSERPIRKNGRNRSGMRSSAKKVAVESESCGEVEDLGNFKEKLSGSNVSGYGDDSENRQPKRERRFDRDGRRGRGERNADAQQESAPVAEQDAAAQPADAESADTESKPAGEKPEREGPFFESKKFAPRAVEVPLTDHRPKFSNDKAQKDDGVISYSAKTPDCPSLSLFARIKKAVASLFGKKRDDGKKKYRRDGRKGDFKGHRHHRNGGDKKYYNKNRGNGDFKRRHDNRPRRENGGK